MGALAYIVIGLVSIGLAQVELFDYLEGYLPERCPRWSPNNLAKFEEDFTLHVFGQDLVLDLLGPAIRSHLRNDNPSKPLVLSFHGWTGNGKTYVSRFLAKSLFKRGIGSQYVHSFDPMKDFPDQNKITEYKRNLQSWIRGNVSYCGQSLFIFEEFDKMPEGLIDAINPFIDHHELVNGVDYRKCIFVFISNAGGKEIAEKAYEYHLSGKARDDLTYMDFEQLVQTGAFNEGGLRNSKLLEKELVDLYVPFLPMERTFVIKCIRAFARQKGFTLQKKEIDDILGKLTWDWPNENGIYTKSGCRKLEQKVNFYSERRHEI